MTDNFFEAADDFRVSRQHRIKPFQPPAVVILQILSIVVHFADSLSGK